MGSRLVEILAASTYETAEHPTWITVKGVVKDRGVGEKTIVKPIVGGLTSNDIISLVDEIRAQFNEIYNPDGEYKFSRQEITARADKHVNDKIREVFGDDYVFHDSRSLYAELAFMQYAPHSMSKIAFFASVLGHKEESLTTALSYQKFAVKRKLPEVSADVMSRVTVLEAELEALKKQKQEEKVAQPSQVTLLSRDEEEFT